MTIALTINGVTYNYPETGDIDWGYEATNWAAAVTGGMLQKAGGLFLLQNEVDFGPSQGLKTVYYKSQAAMPATSGVLRLGVNETVCWRNNADDGNLCLSVDASDTLLFDGSPIGLGNLLIAKGDIIVYDGSGYTRLPVGTDGNVLQANSATATGLQWSASAGGLTDPGSNGVVVRTALNTTTARTITNASTRVSVTNGDGVSGNPAIDVVEANLVLNNIGGTLAINKGGTGQTTKVDAFDALSPATTKGDLIVYDGTDNVRQAVGTDGYVLTADSTQSTGVKWAAGTGGLGDPGSNGIVIRTALNTTTTRSIDGPAAGINVSNGDGVSGNPTLSLANDLAAVEGLATTGYAVRTGTDTWATRTLTAGSSKISIGNGNGVSGNTTIDVAQGNVDHNALLNYVANQHIDHSTVAVNAGTGLSGGGVITSSVTLNLDASLTQLNDVTIGTPTLNQVLTWNGSQWINQTPSGGSGTVTSVDVQPAAGVSSDGIQSTGGPITTSGTITLTLANDLAAVEGLASTGLTARTASSTWTTRTITGTANQISVTDGDGVSGNPTLAIANNAVLPGTEGVVVPSGTTAQRPISPTNGEIRYNTDTNLFEVYQNSTWVNLSSASLSGLSDVNISGAADRQILVYDSGTSKWVNQYGAHIGIAVNPSGLATDPVASGIDAIAIGDAASTTADYGIAIGYQSNVARRDSIAIGRASNTETNEYGIAIGWDANIDDAGFANSASYSIAIGASAGVSRSNSSIAIGYGAQAGNGVSGAASNIAIGVNAQATGTTNCMAIGNSVTNNANNTAAFGVSSGYLRMNSLGQMVLSGSDAAYLLPQYNLSFSPPSGNLGALIYNTDTDTPAYYDGISWVDMAGGGGTVTSVAATAPAAGFTISGSPITTSGTLTFTLADDLAAVEGLASTGIAARTASNTWTTRTITAGTGISVTNGDGVSGNPTINSTITQYTDEMAQDAVGNILTDTSTIDFTYNDVGNQITAAVIPGGVNHNALLNYVANQHVDHSSVSITAGTGLSGGGDITTSRTINLANTTVTPNSYGSASSVATFTVDAQGRLTAASNTSIQIAQSQVTNLVTDLAGKQPLDATLTALAAYNTNGLLTQTAADTFTGRTITAGTGISVTNGNGVSGNPTISSTITQYTDEMAQDAVGNILTDTSTIDFTYNDAGNQITAAVIANSSVQKVEVVKNSGAVVGTRKQLNFIEGSNVTLTIADDAGNDQVDITITATGSGSSPLTTKGDIYTYSTTNDRLPVGTNGQILSANSATSTGLEWINNTTGTVTSVAATAPAAGFTISGSPITTSGTLTFTLADDLAAVEGLASTGLATRTASNTWTTRTLTAGSSKLSVSNGDGVSGNPTVDVVEANLTLNNISGTLGTTKGGTNLTTYTQGDILYSDAANSLAKLAKDTNATRYLSNTGASNNPAWSQVNLANGVTGTLPVANGGTGTTNDVKKFTMQILLEAGADNTYTMMQSARFGFTIDAAYYQTDAGTITANVRINTTSVTSLSALSLSSTPGNTSATGANTVTTGDKVNVVFSSNSSATFVSVMLECTRT